MGLHTNKLGSDKSYHRPAVTYTEQLSADEIAELLQGYAKVDDITEVPIDTHIRYFITDQETGKQLFRTGGMLRNKQNAETYVMLSNGKSSWSVQVAGTVFFRKLNHKEEIAELNSLWQKKLRQKEKLIAQKDQEIAQKDQEIHKLKKHIKKHAKK